MTALNSNILENHWEAPEVHLSDSSLPLFGFMPQGDVFAPCQTLAILDCVRLKVACRLGAAALGNSSSSPTMSEVTGNVSGATPPVLGQPCALQDISTNAAITIHDEQLQQIHGM